MTSIRLGSLQRAGIECHALLDEIDAFDIVGDRLVFDPLEADRVASLVNDASNSADAQAERDGNRDDRRMARALANLAARVRSAA